jgi:hypothetical protein
MLWMRSSLVGGLTLGALVGCTAPAVTWTDATAVASAVSSPLVTPPVAPFDSALRDDTPQALQLAAQDLTREIGAATALTPLLLSITTPADRRAPSAALAPHGLTDVALGPLGAGEAPVDAERCPRSLRVALSPGRGRVAVWWTRRSRGRVALMAAWRDTVVADGTLGPWRGPLVVDSLDQGPLDARAAEREGVSCARPAPSVVVDEAQGYVHVGYTLVGPEGPGVFYAHQMDPRAAFELPQAIVYGDQLGAVRVAASGSTVAIVYDDPNSGNQRPRIGLAISRTAGHTFEDRLLVSGNTATARDPYVALSGPALVVGWSEWPTPTATPVFRTRRGRLP